MKPPNGKQKAFRPPGFSLQALPSRFYQRLPSRLCALFITLILCAAALYLAGSREGWTDSALRFLAQVLFLLGFLCGASALLGILFDIAQTLVFKKLLSAPFIIIYFIIGAAGFALGLAGGVFQTVQGGYP